MHHLIWKGAIGVGASAGVAGVVALTLKSSPPKEEPKPISKLLSDNEPGKRLLFSGYQGKGGGTHNTWKFVWDKYRNDYSNEKSNPFSLTISGNKGDAAPEAFMNACKNLFNEKVESIESDKYVLVLEYCTRPTLVSDWVWGMGNEMASQSADGDIWSGLWDKYKKSQKNELGLETRLLNGSIPQEFKKQCASVSIKPSNSSKDPLVLTVFNYCSKVRQEAKK